MTKAEIIKAVADSIEQDKKTVADICNAFLFEIKEMLISGGTVEIVGFGNFKVVERGEKEGRNPRTGEKLIIAAHKVAHFTPSKNINRALN